jgi:septum formation protein
MLDNLRKYDIILASQSPRRQELLKGLDIPFTVQTLPGLEENYPEHLQGEEIPRFLAELKASAFKNLLKENTLIITADTIVCLDNKVLGKPADLQEAKVMLQTLSGKEHLVITGVSIQTKEKKHSFTATSKVRFASLSDEQIDYYLSVYSPLDKAGSYGVQEWIGYVAVEHIEGSYFNVMGLPIQKLYSELKKF